MSRKPRTHDTAQEKVAILRVRHHLNLSRLRAKEAAWRRLMERGEFLGSVDSYFQGGKLLLTILDEKWLEHPTRGTGIWGSLFMVLCEPTPCSGMQA